MLDVKRRTWLPRGDSDFFSVHTSQQARTYDGEFRQFSIHIEDHKSIIPFIIYAKVPIHLGNSVRSMLNVKSDR